MNTTLESNYLIDPNTGEILDQELGEIGPVIDDEKAHWILKKLNRLRIDQMVASRHYRESKERLESLIQSAVDEAMKMPEAMELQSIINNSNDTIETASKRETGILAYFALSLDNWIRPKLGKKGKTHKTPFGSIQVKDKKPQIKITNPGRAVEALEAAGIPGAISKTPLISKVPKDLINEILSDATRAEQMGMSIQPARTELVFHTEIN